MVRLLLQMIGRSRLLKLVKLSAGFLFAGIGIGEVLGHMGIVSGSVRMWLIVVLAFLGLSVILVGLLVLKEGEVIPWR